MAFDDIVLNYQGFHPSEFTQDHLVSLIRGLYEKSPSGAKVKASFSQRENLFKGVIKITSSAGSFFAVANGPALNEVSKKLFFQIKKRLDKYKSRRINKKGLKALFRRPIKEMDQ